MIAPVLVHVEHYVAARTARFCVLDAQTSASCRICFATQARSDERPLTEARPNWRGRLFRSSRSERSRESARQPRQAIRGLDKILFPKFWSFLRYLQKEQGAMLTMADNLHCGTLGCARCRIISRCCTVNSGVTNANFIEANPGTRRARGASA